MTTAIINRPNFLHRLESTAKGLRINLAEMSDLSRRKFLQIAAAASRLALSPQSLLQKALHEAPVDPIAWFDNYSDLSCNLFNARASAISSLEVISSREDIEAVITQQLPMLKQAYLQMQSILEQAHQSPGLMQAIKQDDYIQNKLNSQKQMAEESKNIALKWLKDSKRSNRNSTLSISILQDRLQRGTAIVDYLKQPNLFGELYGSSVDDFLRRFSIVLRRAARELIKLPQINKTKSTGQAKAHSESTTSQDSSKLINQSYYSNDMEALIYATLHNRPENLDWFERAYAEKFSKPSH